MHAKAKKPAQRSKQEEQANLFGQLVLFIGGGATLASLWFNTVVPVVVAIVGLFCLLSFMNGLS